MKRNTVGTLAAMFLSIPGCVALLSGSAARACTVFCDSQGDTVLAGRSFDIPDNPNLGMLLVPAKAGLHGWFCCGRFNYPWADGMNDHGLFAAVADVPTPDSSTSGRQPADLQSFISGLLANNASVDEAINWCRKQPAPCLGGGFVHTSQGYAFNTPEHILVADRSGDSVVFEWNQGKIKITRKRGRYQLMTNFLLTDTKAGNYPCSRYVADSKILDAVAAPSLQTCRQVLETTSQGITRYSLVCDLTHGDVYVYLRRQFDQPMTLDLADELKKGRHEIDFGQWFRRSKPEPLSPPPVIARSTLSAEDVLRRALVAIGGEKAAAGIHSFHAKGTAEILDVPSFDALPFEYFAMQPNRFRSVADIIASTGQNLGQCVQGFDGHIGWNTWVDGSCHILRGQEYELRKDGAVFDPTSAPGNHEKAECLGEANFDGKLCYDIKEVSKTHHESFEYYSTTNFLLVGTFSHDIDLGDLSWSKSAFSDYRAFDGFLMPMHTDSQDDFGHYRLQYSSLEINTVTNIPSAPLFTHVDLKTYDTYVGQYRKSLLFGLLHFGPTFSVSYAKDDLLGDHLVGSVRGLREFPAGYNAGDFLAVKQNSFIIDPEITDAKIQLTFDRPRNGKTTRVIINWNGRILSGARISDKPAG